MRRSWRSSRSAGKKDGAGGKPDPAKLEVISFDPCGNTYVKMSETVGKAFQDGGKLK